MAHMEPEKNNCEYRCPGQDYPVSQAVHMARLAGFYPPCRTCPHCEDTGRLSQRVARRVEETRVRAGVGEVSLFFDGGAAGVYLNHIGSRQAQRMAAALGLVLREAREPNEAEPPVAIVAGDGRAIVPELVAAVAEGLRWSGCHVVDIGSASSPCTAFAVGHFEADGGILVGNPGREPQTVGLKFWGSRGRPLSMGAGSPSLDDVRRIYEDLPGRPCRKYGSLRQLQVEDGYLATLDDHYHALRPLRVLLDCGCRPLAEYLQRLTGPLACEIIHCSEVRENDAHLGVSIEGNGETCAVFDERGEAVETERLTSLIGRHRSAQIDGDEPTADALRTVTILLEILSQSDSPLSSVLDG